ncbi:Retinol dehydrogenase 14 (Alcohol dehydrogenase PAN2), partial [Durusdinium trenchii]
GLPKGVPVTRKEVDLLKQADTFDSAEIYATGKLSNILFARELDRRLHAKGVTANAVHPGLVSTNFLTNSYSSGEVKSAMEPLFRFLRYVMSNQIGHNLLYWTPDNSALSTVAAAVKPDGVHGEYIVPLFRVATHVSTAQAQDDDAAKELWDLSAKLVKEFAPKK